VQMERRLAIPRAAPDRDKLRAMQNNVGAGDQHGGRQEFHGDSAAFGVRREDRSVSSFDLTDVIADTHEPCGIR
jgi:hypothetical protein